MNWYFELTTCLMHDTFIPMIITLTIGYIELHIEIEYAKTKLPSVHKISKVRMYIMYHVRVNRRDCGDSLVYLAMLVALAKNLMALAMRGSKQELPFDKMTLRLFQLQLL